MFLQLCTILCALLNGASFPRNKNAFLGKKTKTNQHFKISFVSPTWYILCKTLCLKHHFHCYILILTLDVLQKGKLSRQDFSSISEFESVVVALGFFPVLMWPHILCVLVFLLMGAGPNSFFSVRT